MSRTRSSQHRPPREHPAKEVAQLRQENRSLKKKIASLRKQVAQAAATAEVETPETETLHKWQCPVCAAHELGMFTTPNGTAIRYCIKCKTKYDTDAA